MKKESWVCHVLVCLCVWRYGEREDSDEEDRERYKQASHLFQKEKWASEEGV
ncbi:unnamed protein product [Camellia sinensis]